MERMEAEGKTIDQAIEDALKKLGTTRDRVTVEILAEARKGVFGIGGRKARVRASLRNAVMMEEPDDPIEPVPKKVLPEKEVAAVREKGKEILGEIVRLIGVQATIEAKPGDTPEEILLDIHGDNGGLLIGRRGQTLEALQYILARVVCEKQGTDGVQLVVDTENYLERRKKTLEDMALRLGEKAKRKRTTVTVDSLSARDRRIVHLALEDDPWLTTSSLGNGAYRRLLIIPEGDRKKKEQEEKPAPNVKSAKG
jgi:spoIIIJ-associated protein